VDNATFLYPGNENVLKRRSHFVPLEDILSGEATILNELSEITSRNFSRYGHGQIKSGGVSLKLASLFQFYVEVKLNKVVHNIVFKHSAARICTQIHTRSFRSHWLNHHLGHAFA
jgi:hypothetical protein